MSKIAFIFPGQGAQYVGMGKVLFDNHPLAREAYEQANQALKFDITKICFESTPAELRMTHNAQPAILIHSVAAFRLIEREGVAFDYVAGHSLGEYSALVAAGALSLEDAVRLVRIRGSLMSIAGDIQPGTMAAILGLEPHDVEHICFEAREDGIVEAANFNSQEQTVISGEVKAVLKAMEMAKAKGAKRAIQLEVSGAFHSELMDIAQYGMRRALNQLEIKEPRCPVIANVTASPVHHPSTIRELLIEQVKKPVRWEESVKRLAALGVDTMVECGPGRVLKGLIKRIAPEVTVHNVEDSKTLAETIAALKH
jgi:[acyl-carrier-protein] S-malonyltransferase